MVASINACSVSRTRSPKDYLWFYLQLFREVSLRISPSFLSFLRLISLKIPFTAQEDAPAPWSLSISCRRSDFLHQMSFLRSIYGILFAFSNWCCTVVLLALLFSPISSSCCTEDMCRRVDLLSTKYTGEVWNRAYYIFMNVRYYSTKLWNLIFFESMSMIRIEWQGQCK